MTKVYLCLGCKALSDHEEMPTKCPECKGKDFIQGIEHLQPRDILKPLMSKDKKPKWRLS